MKQLKALEILKFMKMSSSSNITILNEAIAELEALDNRSCENCKHNEITICKKLPSIDWSFEPTNDFDCRKWESI